MKQRAHKLYGRINPEVALSKKSKKFYSTSSATRDTPLNYRRLKPAATITPILLTQIPFLK